jgi:hypothetical protein
MVFMSIESMLAKDFSALVRKFNADGFAERSLAKLKGVEKMRLVVVGGAGAAGAALAASQFEALSSALTESIPMLANLTVANSAITLDMGAAPMLMTALLFAVVGGATAIIVPGSR